MSDLSSKRNSAASRDVSACFCQQCSRVLYVAEADLLFCPVCSSLVMRIDAEDETNLPQGSRAADR